MEQLIGSILKRLPSQVDSILLCLKFLDFALMLMRRINSEKLLDLDCYTAVVKSVYEILNQTKVQKRTKLEKQEHF